MKMKMNINQVKLDLYFYKNFKMAIRAILMTNNKVVNVEHFNQ